MRLADREIAELVAALYEAAIDPDLWQIFLRLFSAAVRGTQSGLLFLDSGRPDCNIAATYGLNPEAQRLYGDYFWQVDEWYKGSIAVASPGLIGDGRMLCPEPKLLRSEFYNDYLRKYDQFYEAFGIIRKTGPSAAIVTVLRPKASGEFDSSHFKILELLMPHMQRALQLHSKVADVHDRNARGEAILEMISSGVVFVDIHGRVIQMNRTAEALLRKRDGLSLTRNRLQAASPSEDRKLQALIQGANHILDAPGWRSTATLSVSRTSIPQALHLFITPLRPIRGIASTRATAAIFIVDSEQKLLPPIGILKSLYQLTPAESRLAILLMNGIDITHAAELTGTSRNTTRTHARRLFQKLGVKRQSEVVSLLLRVLGQFRTQSQ